MAHGQPDYGAYQAKTTTFGLSDLAELAARLGSIVTYDRRGDIVWLDDFESGEDKWASAIFGNNAAVALSTVEAHGGAFSIKLTTGDAKGDFASITKRFQYPVVGKFGFEAAFTVDTAIQTIELRITVQTGTRQLQAGVRLNYVTSKLEYYDSDGNWTELASSISTTELSTYFYIMKLVCDIDNELYTRLIFGGIEYDLSALSIYATANVDTPIMTVVVIATTEAAANTSIYVDNVIVTQNEP